MLKSIFFGCSIGQSGHFYLTNDRGGSLHHSSLPNLEWLRRIDGLFADKGRGQSVCVLHHLHQATVLSFEDFSQDSRPGSNGNYILFERDALFEYTLQQFQADFPLIFARVNAARPLTLAP